MKIANIAKGISVAARCPATPFQKKDYLMVVSHMRSYSTLLCHILGNHAEIDGYAETHQAYTSPRALTALRMRVCHLTGKPLRGRYVLDKVLHGDHVLAPSVTALPNVRFLVMLRDAEATLKSIIKRGRMIGPPFPNTYQQACDYYCARVAELKEFIPTAPDRTLYLDASCLVADSQPTLDRLGLWLDLKTPLDAEYQTFAYTGKGTYGDSSEAIYSGTIQAKENRNSEIQIPEPFLSRAKAAYDDCRNAWLRASCTRITLPAAREQVAR